MGLLVFKLLVTPLLLLAASLAVRRWGDTIGGFIVGLPLTSGPVSVFLALEYGPAFARQATVGSLAGTVAQVGFGLVYCRLATRGWIPALIGAAIAYACVGGVLQWSAMPPWALFLVAIAAMLLMLRVTPESAAPALALRPPPWDLPARMILITGLVVAVTLAAPAVGPKVSGVLASFPLMGLILAIFAHRMRGPAAAQKVMRGMVAGLMSFAAFFFVLSLTLDRIPPLGAYVLALGITLVVQAVVLRRIGRARPETGTR